MTFQQDPEPTQSVNAFDTPDEESDIDKFQVISDQDKELSEEHLNALIKADNTAEEAKLSGIPEFRL